MRLACVFAHPDDETFSVGGTLAYYAARGATSALYCATDGAAGRSSGIAVASREELAALRRRELVDACGQLGISALETPGHDDGALGQVEAEVLIEEVVGFLRRHRPDVVLTFGPEGAPTGHRDHRVISRAATTAFFLAGLATEFADQGLAPHSPARLFYVAWPEPDPAAELPRLSVPATTVIDVAAHLETKMAAFMRHATQRDHLARFEKLGMTESERFALAAGPPGARTDLFEELSASA